jgi:lambda family phage tail tape measure protein
MKVNEELIRSKTNIRAAAEEARDFNTAILGAQTGFGAQIAAAQRANNQVKAIRLQGEEASSLFEMQARDKSAKDQVDREVEIAAFKRKTNQDTQDKIAAYNQQQSQALAQFNLGQRQTLFNYEEANRLVSQNIGFETSLIGKTAEQVEIERARESILRNQVQSIKTLQAEIEKLELAKKLNTDPQAGPKIEKIRETIKGIQTDTAVSGNSVQGFIERLQGARAIEQDRKNQLENMVKLYDQQEARAHRLSDILVAANRTAAGATQAPGAGVLVGLTSIQRQIVDIQEQGRKSALSAKEAFAAAFGDVETLSQGEELMRGLDQIDAAYQRVIETQKQVAKNNYDISRSFDTGVRDAFTNFVESANDSASQVKNSFNTFTTGLEDAFVKLAQTGKLSFADLANSIIADLVRISVRKAVVGIGSFFGLPGLASGGPVQPNQPYIVGEKGPELFLPTGAGSIIPNNKMGTGASGGGAAQANVTYNIQAVDAASFRSLVARDPSFIYAVTEQGRRSQPVRSR